MMECSEEKVRLTNRKPTGNQQEWSRIHGWAMNKSVVAHATARATPDVPSRLSGLPMTSDIALLPRKASAIKFSRHDFHQNHFVRPQSHALCCALLLGLGQPEVPWPDSLVACIQLHAPSLRLLRPHRNSCILTCRGLLALNVYEKRRRKQR